MPAEVALHVPESLEDGDVEEEERDEGHDARRHRPRPVHVRDDVRPAQAEAAIHKKEMITRYTRRKKNT